jgi:hypothetical protein
MAHYLFHRRDGEADSFGDPPLRANYDLVVVGGIGGLAAAFSTAEHRQERAHSHPGQSRRLRRPREAQ